MKKFRLIRSLPMNAEENMAFDKAMFENYLDDAIPRLRVYSWDGPAFTYGVSQDPSDGLDYGRCLRDKVGVAKRITGGGILFHHDEITYSFACGKQEVGEPEGTLVSYREICGFLIRFYRSLGLDASYALDSPEFSGRSAPHRLCSASHEKFDIVVGGRKIGGNAQKRGRQGIFQHGSIPRAIDWNLVSRYVSLPSDISASVTSLSEHMTPAPEKEELEQKLIDAFAAEFGVDYETGLA